MKRKISLITAIMVIVIGCFSACGSSSSEDVDITASWTLVEMTVSGKTVSYEQIPADSLAPQFSCSDGKNFTFTSNGKIHTGTLTESNGVYTLNYDDTDAKMEAVISGEKMTISVVGGTSTFVFEAK